MLTVTQQIVNASQEELYIWFWVSCTFKYSLSVYEITLQNHPN